MLLHGCPISSILGYGCGSEVVILGALVFLSEFLEMGVLCVKKRPMQIIPYD